MGRFLTIDVHKSCMYFHQSKTFEVLRVLHEIYLQECLTLLHQLRSIICQPLLHKNLWICVQLDFIWNLYLVFLCVAFVSPYFHPGGCVRTFVKKIKYMWPIVSTQMQLYHSRYRIDIQNVLWKCDGDMESPEIEVIESDKNGLGEDSITPWHRL